MAPLFLDQPSESPAVILDSPNLLLWEAYVESGLSGKWTIYNTVLERQLARVLGWNRLGPWLPVEAYEQLKDQASVEAILGWWEPTEDSDDQVGWHREFHRGAADLTEQQARAFGLWLDGHSIREIAEYLDRKRGPDSWAPLTTRAAELHLQKARLQLARFFGTQAQESPAA